MGFPAGKGLSPTLGRWSRAILRCQGSVMFARITKEGKFGFPQTFTSRPGPSLKVNEPGDIFENEADRVADETVFPASARRREASLSVQRRSTPSDPGLRTADEIPGIIQKALRSPPGSRCTSPPAGSWSRASTTTPHSNISPRHQEYPQLPCWPVP